MWTWVLQVTRIFPLTIANRSPGSLETILKGGLEKADVIITTGGVSMGELDLLKPTIERSLNGTIHFGRKASPFILLLFIEQFILIVTSFNLLYVCV